HPTRLESIPSVGRDFAGGRAKNAAVETNRIRFGKSQMRVSRLVIFSTICYLKGRLWIRARRDRRPVGMEEYPVGLSSLRVDLAHTPTEHGAPCDVARGDRRPDSSETEVALARLVGPGKDVLL